MKVCSGNIHDLHRHSIPDEVRRLFDTNQKLQLFRQHAVEDMVTLYCNERPTPAAENLPKLPPEDSRYPSTPIA